MTIKIYQCFIVLLFVALSINSKAQKFTNLKDSDVSKYEADSHGAVWQDYNDDGWVDLFISNLDGPDFLFKNFEGVLKRIYPKEIVEDSSVSASAVWLDYDKDGDADLFVSKGSTKRPLANSLYRNEGSDLFRKLQPGQVGELLQYEGFTESASAADINLDGYPDIIEVNWRAQPDLIYINQNDGTYKKIEYPRLTNVLDFGITANWVDLNRDSLIDLFIARQGYAAGYKENAIFELSENNRLYIQGKNGKFQPRRSKVGTKINPEVNDGGSSITASFGDYNNDGWLDLYVGNFGGEENFLYQNEGNGNFIRQEEIVVDQDGGFTIGSSWGDLNNDGYLDLLAVNGYQVPETNNLYINSQNGSFEKVENSDLSEKENRQVSTAFADFDNDGDLDLVIVGRKGTPNELYRNENESHNWLKVKPVGNHSTTLALNTKAEIWYEECGRRKYQYRELHQQTGYGGHNELVFHFGLGNAANIDSLKIFWPNKKIQKFTDVVSNGFYYLKEGEHLVKQ